MGTKATTRKAQRIGRVADLQSVAQEARKRLKAKSCAIFIVDAAGLLRIKGSDSSAQQSKSGESIAISISSEPRKGLTGSIAAIFKADTSRTVIRLHGRELIDHPCVRNRRTTHSHLGEKCESILAVVLRSRKGDFLGLLKVENKRGYSGTETTHCFDFNDEVIATSLAVTAVDILETRQLLDELGHLLSALHGTPSPKQVYSAIIACTMKALGADKVHISAENARQNKYRSSIAAPLNSSHMVLRAFSKHTNFFDQQDRSVLSLIGRYASLSLSIVNRQRSLWSLFRRVIEGGGDKDDLYRELVRLIVDNYGLSGGLIYQLSPNADTLRCTMYVGPTSHVSGARNLVYPLTDSSFATRVFHGNRAAFVLDPTNDPSVCQKQRRRFSIEGSLLGAPLSAKGMRFGAMVFWSDTVDALHKDKLPLIASYAKLFSWGMLSAQQRRTAKDFDYYFNQLVHTFKLSEFRKSFPDLTFVYANSEFRKFIQRTKNEILGKTDKQIFPAKYAVKYQSDDLSVAKSRRGKRFVEDHKLPDGTVRSVKVYKQLWRSKSGSPEVRGVFKDVSEEKKRRLLERQRKALSRIGGEITRCQNEEDLYKYCVVNLPRSKLFGAKFASIFTLAQQSSSECDYLVLRRSSYPLLENFAHQRVYEIRKDAKIFGLTEWVALKGRSLRLELGDSKALSKRLKTIDLRLRHKRGIVDSDKHTTFLAVPILTPDDQGERRRSCSVGVLRMSQMDSKSEFSEEQQTLLQTIVTDYVAPKMRQLQELACTLATDCLETEIATATSNAERRIGGLSRIIETVIKGVVSKHYPNIRKSFWISRILPNGKRLMIEGRDFLVASNPTFRSCGTVECELLGSMTAHCIKSGVRSAFSTGHPESVTWRKSEEIFPDSRYSIVAPVRVKNQVIGAIGISSSAFDIDQRSFSLVLERLASFIGQELIRRSFRPTFTQAIFRHDAIKPLQWAESYLSCADESLSGKHLEYTKTAITLTTRLALAYSRAYKIGEDGYRPVDEPNVDLQSTIESAVRIARRLVADPLEVNGEAPLPQVDCRLTLNIDADIVVAVVFNLLKNALMVCSAKWISVSANLVEGGIKIIVSDKGPGIPPEKWERFRRYDVSQALGGDSSADRTEQGLGLMYCSYFVENWNVDGNRGSISIDYSYPAQKCGAAISVFLPTRTNNIQQI